MNDELRLPNDERVECAALSGFLLGIEEFSDHQDALSKELFFNNSNKIIFSTIETMSKLGEKVDLITVTSRLKSLNLLDQVGGTPYISKIASTICNHSPSEYGSILKEKFNLRKLIEMSDSINNRAYQEDNSLELIKDIQKKSFDLQIEEKSQNLLESSTDGVLNVIDMKIRGEKIQGLQTEIEPWDRVLGGLNPRFYVLAARAGKGKTAMMEQIVTSLLTRGHPTLVFEKDMSPDLFILRMSCRASGVSFTKFDTGYCSKEECEEIKKAVLFFKKSPLKLYSPAGFTVSNFTSIIKKEKRLNGIKAVFLDHILNLDVGQDYRTGLTLASTRIRDSVEENKIPHVILAQLNRGAHNCERPTPAHIKEFDALYADCDAMMMLWSEKEAQDLQAGELHPIKFTVNKNRYGTEFEETLGFDRPLMKFRSLKK